MILESECPKHQRVTEETGVVLNYLGPSMNPVLKDGDRLRTTPYRNSRIRVGDVVVFRSVQRGHYVVHRVVSVHSQGVRTRGDNNRSIDPWVLCSGDIIGRVVSAQRKNRTITIHGGMPGRILAWTLWVVKRANMAIFRILRPVYRYLVQSGVFSKLVAHRIRTHVLYFKRPNGTEMQLLLGQWVIGRCPPGKEQWHIRRPFRLFVDEASLPRVSSGSTTVKPSE